VNDRPELVEPIADQSVAEDAQLSIDLAEFFEDIDTGTTLSFAATLDGGADLPAGGHHLDSGHRNRSGVGERVGHL
jgi:hypothetical protein